MDPVDVAGPQVPRQLAGQGHRLFLADAPRGEDDAADDGGERPDRGGGEPQRTGGDGPGVLQGGTDRGGGTETADETDGQHHAEPVLGAPDRGEEEHSSRMNRPHWPRNMPTEYDHMVFAPSRVPRSKVIENGIAANTTAMSSEV